MIQFLDYGDISLDTLQEEITFEQRSVVVYGKTYPQPRLTKWYGPVPYAYSGLTWPACPLTPLLEEVLSRVEDMSRHKFNSVLCNLYRDGHDNVGWHSDDEPLFGSDPVVASLSFGATRTFKLRRIQDRKEERYELRHGSLLVMGKGVQTQWQHCIPKAKSVTEPRINLTFRWAY